MTSPPHSSQEKPHSCNNQNFHLPKEISAASLQLNISGISLLLYKIAQPPSLRWSSTCEQAGEGITVSKCGAWGKLFTLSAFWYTTEQQAKLQIILKSGQYLVASWWLRWEKSAHAIKAGSRWAVVGSAPSSWSYSKVRLDSQGFEHPIEEEFIFFRMHMLSNCQFWHIHNTICRHLHCFLIGNTENWVEICVPTVTSFTM